MAISNRKCSETTDTYILCCCCINLNIRHKSLLASKNTLPIEK